MNEQYLIVYAGKYGSTNSIAEYISAELRGYGAWVDVTHVNDAIEIRPYAAVIISSAINFGKIRPEALEFIQEYKETLSQIPTAFFLTCLDLVRVPEEYDIETSIFIDPALGRPPKRAGKLSMWEKMHLLSTFMNPVTKAAPNVKPISIGVFKGVLDYKVLSFPEWLLIRPASLIIKQIAKGDFRNWQAIRDWTGILYPLLQTHGLINYRKERQYEYE